MMTTVDKIVPHEDVGMEVHVNFRDESQRPHPSVKVIVYIEKRDHPLSEVKSLAIQKALDLLSQITHSEVKAHGV